MAAFPRRAAVEVMRGAVLAAERGDLLAPARVQVADLSFTAGGDASTFGFRAYHRRQTPHDDQVVVVWDALGRISGVVVGEALGPLRTAALGALATQTMARPDAACLGLIGSGMQAHAHALTVAAIRPLSRVLVYSRGAQRREALARDLRGAGLPAQAADDARAVCEASDLLTLATDSTVPVIEASWVRPGTHVCTLGPKVRGGHECPLELADRAAQIVTDSLTQLQAYEGGHILNQSAARSLGHQLLHPVSRRPEDITLFLSVGLAGTEVMLADALLKAGTQS